jgi:hypothetical protein
VDVRCEEKQKQRERVNENEGRSALDARGLNRFISLSPLSSRSRYCFAKQIIPSAFLLIKTNRNYFFEFKFIIDGFFEGDSLHSMGSSKSPTKRAYFI